MHLISILGLALTFTTGPQGTLPVEYRAGVTLQLGVGNMDRSIRFYQDTLGFRLTERRDDLKFAHIATNVPGLELGLNEVASPAPSPAVVVNISVMDVAAARAALEARGVAFTRPTQVIPGKVALADFLDPDGHRLRLAGPPPGGASVREPLDPVVSSLRRQLAIVGAMFVRSAETASAEDYRFKPTPDVRSLVDLFMHAVTAQLYVCGQVAGQRLETPAYARTFKGAASFKDGDKAQVVASLASSFEQCDTMLASLTPDRFNRLVAPGFLSRVMGEGDAPALALVSVNLAHMYEHYGNVVTYLRLRGLVPPSSESLPPGRQARIP